MLEVFGIILFVLGPILAAVILIGVPVVIALIAYDLFAVSRTEGPKPETLFGWSQATEARIRLERGVARSFVVVGGVFWAATLFAGLFAFRNTGMQFAALAAAVPMIASAITLVVGWFWERAAAIMLTVASIGVVYWGVVAQFELGVWAIVMFALIGPMLTAAALFWLARRDFEALEVFRLSHPEPALLTADAPTR